MKSKTIRKIEKVLIFGGLNATVLWWALTPQIEAILKIEREAQRAAQEGIMITLLAYSIGRRIGEIIKEAESREMKSKDEQD